MPTQQRQHRAGKEVATGTVDLHGVGAALAQSAQMVRITVLDHPLAKIDRAVQVFAQALETLHGQLVSAGQDASAQHTRARVFDAREGLRQGVRALEEIGDARTWRGWVDSDPKRMSVMRTHIDAMVKMLDYQHVRARARSAFEAAFGASATAGPVIVVEEQRTFDHDDTEDYVKVMVVHDSSAETLDVDGCWKVREAISDAIEETGLAGAASVGFTKGSEWWASRERHRECDPTELVEIAAQNDHG